MKAKDSGWPTFDEKFVNYLHDSGRSGWPTAPHLSTGILNPLQPAQAEVVLGQLSTYLASWEKTMTSADIFHYIDPYFQYLLFINQQIL
jgi:hypothetical protein